MLVVQVRSWLKILYNNLKELFPFIRFKIKVKKYTLSKVKKKNYTQFFILAYSLG